MNSSASDNASTVNPAPRRRRVRWGRALLIVGAILAAAFWGVAFRWLNGADLARLVIPQVNAQLRGTLAAKEVWWGFTLPIDLLLGLGHEVTVRDVTAADTHGRTIITVPEVRVRVHLWPLLAGKLKFSDAHIQHPSVVIEEGNETELVGIAETFLLKPRQRPRDRDDDSGGGIRIDVANFSVHDAEVLFRFSPWAMRLSSLSVSGDFAFDGGDVDSDEGLSWDVRAEASSGSMYIDTLFFPLHDVTVVRSVMPRHAHKALTADIVAHSGDAELRAVGSLPDLLVDTMRGDVRFSVHNGSRLLGVFGAVALPLQITQMGDISGRMTGPLSSPIVDARIVDLAADVPEFPQLKPQKFAGSFRWDTTTEAFSVKDVAGEIAGGTLGGDAVINLKQENFHINAKPKNVQVETVFPELIGRWSGALSLEGKLASPLQGMLTTDSQFVPGPGNALWLPSKLRITSRARILPARFDLLDLTLAQGKSHVRLTGHIGRPNGDVKLQAVARLDEADDWLGGFGIPMTAGSLDLDVAIDGTYPALRAQGSVAALAFGYQRLRLSEVRAECALVDGRIWLRNITGRGYGGRIVGEAWFDAFAAGDITQTIEQPLAQVELRAEQIRLQDLVAANVSGTLAAQVELQRVEGFWEGVAEISMDDGNLWDDRYAASTVRLGVLRDRLSVYRARLIRADDGAIVLVQGDLFYGGALDLTVETTRFPLHGLPSVRKLPFPVGGLVDGRVAVRGTTKQPELQGTVSLTRAFVRRWQLGAGTLTLNPAVGGTSLDGEFFSGLLAISGTIRLNPTFKGQLALVVKNLPLEELFDELHQVGEIRGRTTGKVALNLDQERGLAEVVAELEKLRLTLSYQEQAGYETERVEAKIANPLRVSFDARSSRVVLENVVLESAIMGRRETKGRIAIHGEYSPTGMSLDAEGSLPLAVAEFLLTKQVKSIAGFAETALHVRGTPARPDILGTVELKGVEFRLPKADAPLTIPKARLELREGALTVEELVIEMASHRCEGRGSVELQRLRPVALDMQLAGDLDLQILQVIWPNYFSQSGGVASVASLRVEGPIGDPSIRGRVAARNIELAVRGVPRLFLVEHGEVEFSNYLIRTVSPLEGRYDEGLLQLSGSVRLDHGRPIDIDLELIGSGIPIRAPEVYSIEINPRLHLYGDDQQLELIGEVDLADARYVREFEFLQQQVMRPRIAEERVPPWHGTPLLENLRLNVVLRTTGDAMIRNAYANLSVEGALRVAGTFSEPQITGQIRATEGTFSIPFLRGAYRLETGEILFRAERSADQAEVNMVALTDFVDSSGTDYQIRLYLQGPLTSIRRRLTSIPSLPEGQILALLSSGRTVDQWRTQLGEGGGSVTGIADEQVKTITGEILGRAVSDPIKDAIGIDVLRLQLGTETMTASVCESFARSWEVCAEHTQDVQGGFRAKGYGRVPLHDYLNLYGRIERLSSRVTTGLENPSRLRVELKFRFPLR